ncbi:hypothetical protein [Streptomyces sp. BPTC-684]|uniref:hypothetical protein n=1 Tax=Streptomyces sp. BPTC-684 TaxID=3043734 RepID=UPI0024B17A40|nr:hypothetical protein [Streptomyces sp. BPTC-684]WHM36236.1 hypothetical protein QIY60_04350 [Streptomyces sp. BPTC-684]
MGYYPPYNHLPDCGHCGQRLTGRQERYCSPSCRQAAYRATKRPTGPRLKPCPLCGEHFLITSKRKKYCDYYDEAERDCQTMQDDLEEAAWIAAEERKTAECAHCGEPAGWTGRGRPKRFCSRRCRQADYRKRKAQQAA